MDDIGNIVYVLAVVGYMLYRVFAGKKKAPQKGQATPKKGTTIEDILREFTHQEDAEEYVEPVPVEVRPGHEGHVHNPEPFLTVDAPKKPAVEYKMSQSEIFRHQRSDEQLEKESQEEEETYVDQVVGELSNGVDLRKAIIYRAILETPYLR
ncbi:MAG: hypothetical protein ACI9YU_000582 [Flavobacteriales bacterium]|jgi:hypothetical protein